MAVVFINEIHYDNTGTDTGEFVEIAGPAGTDLTGWSLVLYNGNGGVVYNTIDLSSETIDDEGNGFGAFSVATTGIQNGSPDGLALVDNNGSVVQFLSYEGSFAATDGPASGQTSTDIGVSEPGTDAVGLSLQLTGTGTESGDFTWNAPATESPGSINAGQTFGTPTSPNLSIADVTQSEGDSGTTTFTFTVSLSAAAPTDVTFDIATANDTATAGEDYVARALTAQTISAGNTTYSFDVTVNGDTTSESDETFFVNITNVVGATVADAQGVGTITNDDGVAITLISAIQGTGTDSPLVGNTVTIEAIVVGDFQDGDGDTSRNLRGFYVQEEDSDADADPLTSEGIFIFENGNFIVDVNVGDKVQITGTVDEFFGETQIDTITNITVLSSDNPLPTAADIALPAAGTTLSQGGTPQPDLEAFEGMLVNFTDTLTITEMFNLDRFNEIRLSQGDRPQQFTQFNDADVAGYDAHREEVGARTITYDDGLSVQNALIGNLDGFGSTFSTASDIRMGDTIDNLTGVLSYQWAGNSASGATWRVRSTVNGENTFNKVNDRPETPEEVGGSLKVTGFNVLNYFKTIDTIQEGSGSDNPSDNTAVGQDPRGADSTAEFDRQTEKLVTALLAIDADVLGLAELENDFLAGSSGNAIETLVNELNAIAGAGTYAWVDPGTQFVGDDAIAVGLIYKPGAVTPVGNAAILDTPAFLDPNSTGENRNRASLAQTFQEIGSGETFTAVVNHLKSKRASGLTAGDAGNPDSDQGDGQGFWNDTRTKAAQALVDWLNTDPTSSGDTDFLLMGDFNAYAQEDPIQVLRTAGYTDLAQQFGGSDVASYVFDGQTGTLDYVFASSSLLGQVTDAAEWAINADEADAIDYNLDFGRDAAIFDGTTPYRTSDHDPVVVGLELDSTFTLELFHFTDQEPLQAGGSLSDITGLSAILNALRAQDLGDDGLADNTLVLSSGDAIIPGLFYSASAQVFGSRGIADIQIQNELGVQAIAFGNHEFDNGTAELAGLISGNATGDFSALTGSTLEGLDFTGTAFPYLSTNLDFSTDTNLAPLEITGGQAPQPNSVTSSTVILVNGEKIGVVGATTPTLRTISNPGNVGVSPSPFEANPTSEQLDALAAEIQAEVDALLAANPEMNKVVLLAHMQRISIEQELAARLENVDIIVAGGSNTRLFDENDRIRAGDSNQGAYPLFITNAGGTQTAVVNTDGSYKYLGRLVIDFDAGGNIIPESYDPTVSGAYATDAQGVADLNAAGLVDPEIQAIVDAIEDQIIATEGNIFGISDVFLNGFRSGTGSADNPDGVRTQETNLGNLTADANLVAAQAIDPTVVVSIKNGGGIRASIGQVVVPPGGGEYVRVPNLAVLDSEGNLVKPAGGISENDIKTTLAFNNGLSLLTLTKAELIAVLDHGVSALPGVAGQFPQVAGVKFSFDQNAPAGSKIINAGIFDEEDNLIAELMRDGEMVGDPNQTFRVVTLNFLAGGGDGYPFPTGDSANRVDLYDLDGDGNADQASTGDATFAFDGTEQDALAEYLLDNFATDETAFNQADGGPALDDRIQNLAFREDTVLPGITIVESEDSTAVTEGGATDTYTIVLDSQPTADVTITLTPDAQISLNQTTLTFTAENWDVAQTVTVTAVDDDVAEGAQASLISQTVSSADSNYNGIVLEDVSVAVSDNEFGVDLGDSDREKGIIALTNALLLSFQATTTTSFVNELVVFQVKDSEGGVDDGNGGTVSVDDDNYLSAILQASTTQVVFSSLSSDQAVDSGLPSTFNLADLSSELLINASTRLGFMLVVDGTLDDLEAGESREVLLSTQAVGTPLSSLTESGFALTFGEGTNFVVTTSSFDDAIEIAIEASRVGRNVVITNQTVEAIDLSLQTLALTNGGAALAEGDSVNVSITLYREAAFNNTLGFYVADEITGAVIDPQGNSFLPTGDRQAYAAAAFNAALATYNAPPNQSTLDINDLSLTVGNLILPFIISNSSTPNSDFSNVYFPFLSLNADGADHIRLLGSGVFGFEDLPGGGDQDFDDIIAQITAVNV